LFTWVKQNPTPPNSRALRGLLIIDEAKDFIPSKTSTACKDSLTRLTAQARKYKLGIVFATQNPREIENTIIGNCSTHFYGKANSPASIETVQGLVRDRNGNAADIARLKTGVFYVANADYISSPEKITTPLCLSQHRTMDAADIERLALQSREILNGYNKDKAA